MAQLQIPLSIWLSSSPAERDQFYLQAGFDPNLPVVDVGTDTQFVRFQQGDPASPVLSQPMQASITGPQSGDDLRDFAPASTNVPFVDDGGIAFDASVGGATIVSLSRILALLPLALRSQASAFFRTMAINSRVAWQSLPSWLRSALVLVGITGATIVVDEALEGAAPGGIVPFVGPPAPGVDIQIGGHLPLRNDAHIVGSWNTNPSNPAQGVTFYRLSNGWLAVQNKKGRWKTWKPKRPIVLYADGATNMKDMIRADKALNRQAKAIAAMLNRRAKPRKTREKTPTGPIILGNSARVVDV